MHQIINFASSTDQISVKLRLIVKLKHTSIPSGVSAGDISLVDRDRICELITSLL